MARLAAHADLPRLAEEAKRLFGRVTPLDTVPGLEDGIALTTRVPRGVVVAIVPFNYPVELWAHKCAGALAAGNALITKPPEECPSPAAHQRLPRRDRLPATAHQMVTGVGETVGAALVRAAGVQMVAMTGSTATGRAIAEAAAETLKKVHLELGGNDATILCADTDPDAAAGPWSKAASPAATDRLLRGQARLRATPDLRRGARGGAARNGGAENRRPAGRRRPM